MQTGTELIQQRLLRHRTFSLGAEQIRVIDRTELGSQVYDIPYVVLFGDRVEHQTTSLQAALVSAVTGIIAIALGFIVLFTEGRDQIEAAVVGSLFAALWLGCGVYWLFSRRESIQFVEGEYSIYFERANPSVESVEAFIAEAHRRGRSYLRASVLPIQRTDDVRKDRAYAQLLRDRGIISAEEYTEFVHPSHSPYREQLD